jgi:hypothetical protein
MVDFKPWTLPLIVAAIVVPVVAGFMLGGPPLGLGVGFLAVAALVFIAARQRPAGPIETAPVTDSRRHLLIVTSREIDDPASVEAVSRAAGLSGHGQDAEVRVLAPSPSGFLDRWATDVQGAREEAQRKLVITLAAFSRAELSAEAQVGDAGIVQAVEDQLRSFPATEIVLATGPAEEDPEGERAARELSERLEQPFERVELSPSSEVRAQTGPAASSAD